MPRPGPGKLPPEIIRKAPLLDQLHFFFEAKKALAARLLELGTDDPLRPALIELIESYDARLVEIMAELKARKRSRPSERQLNDPPEASKVFTEHMTATTLRERNRAISRAKSHTPLAEACRAAGLQSKNELAKKLKISPGSLVAYEQGRMVPVPVRAKIRSLTKSKLHPDGFDNWPNTEQ